MPLGMIARPTSWPAIAGRNQLRQQEQGREGSQLCTQLQNGRASTSIAETLKISNWEVRNGSEFIYIVLCWAWIGERHAKTKTFRNSKNIPVPYFI